MNFRPMQPTQYFDPHTGSLIRGPVNAPRPLGPAPMRPRLATPRFTGWTRGRFGDFPTNTSGAQGALIAPYTETDIFNPPPGGTGDPGTTTSTSTAPTSDPSQTGYLPTSVPYGQSDRSWTNPTTFATVPINSSTNISVPVLSQNFQRNALIVQNGSTATAVGDVAPTLYVNFNAQPQVGYALALPPGVGVAWDIITPRDSVYVAFGPFVNTGGSVVIAGCVVQGTYSPIGGIA